MSIRLFLSAMIVLTQLFSSPVFAASFDSEICKDLSAVTKEIIELEVSGSRWQGGVSSCLSQKNFKAVSAVQRKVADIKLLDPELILSKGREIKIISEKWLDIGAMEVKFAYIGKKNGVDTPIQDQLVYVLNYGKSRETQGCATVSEEPTHLVMRAECAKD